MFCANDVMALGVIDAARQSGLVIPADLTVVGFDDIPMASWETFRLTTVRADLRGLAATACAQLLGRFADPAGPPLYALIPTELILRGSHAAAQ